MERFDWQKEVLNDESDKIKCLCGRRAGASTVAKIVSDKHDKSLIIHKYGPTKTYINSLLDMLSKTRGVSRLEFENIGNITYFKNGTKKYIDVIKHTSISRNFRSKNLKYDSIVFENIEPEKSPQLEDLVKKIKAVNKDLKVYVLINPTDTEYNWHVVPTVNNPKIDDEYYDQLKLHLNKNQYTQQILAGLMMPEEYINDTKLDANEPKNNVKLRLVVSEMYEDIHKEIKKHVGKPVSECIGLIKDEVSVILSRYENKYKNLVVEDDGLKKRVSGIEIEEKYGNNNKINFELTWEPVFSTSKE